MLTKARRVFYAARRTRPRGLRLPSFVFSGRFRLLWHCLEEAQLFCLILIMWHVHASARQTYNRFSSPSFEFFLIADANSFA